MGNEREGLLTTIRSRRKWYLGVYFLQLIGWLPLIICHEMYFAEPGALTKHVLDAAVTFSFIASGTLITTIFFIDVIFDGVMYLIGKVALMGLLFGDPRKELVAQARKQENERWNAWVKNTPEIRELVESGKVDAPPKVDGK